MKPQVLFGLGAVVLLSGLTACSPSTTAPGVPAAEASTAESTPKAGAPAPQDHSAGFFAPPSELRAELKGSDIDLRWKNNATAPGGAFVEFIMNPGEDFTLLDVCWPDRQTFHHPDIAPDTRFTYRIRPFFGEVSNLVEVTTGDTPASRIAGEAEGPLPETAAKEDAGEPAKSLRSAETFKQAAPDGLTAELASGTTVDLRWKDRAGDEEGYLVEFSAAPSPEFMICALLPPDATSFRKMDLPPQTRCTFRVRAFFSGEPSAQASAGPRQSAQ